MAPNRQARAAATLMWSALPFGAIVTGFNIAGFVQTRANLPRADFADFGSHRIFSIAIFLAAAALVFGLLGGAVRRGRWRRPACLLLLIGAVPATFCVGLYLAFFNNPVTGFQGPGNIQPLVMDAAKPAWYLPALGLTLLAAAATQIVAVVLVTHPKVVTRPDRGAGDVPKGGRALVLTPVLAALYAAVNVVAIAAAGHPPQNDVGPAAARFWTIAYTVALGVVTIPWALVGRFRENKGMRPGALIGLGALAVPYSLLMLSAWRANPMSEELIADRDTRITPPDWYPPVLVVFAAVAGLWLVANLVTLARTSLTNPIRPPVPAPAPRAGP